MLGQYPFKSLDRGNQPLALAGDRPYVSQPLLEQTLLHLGATNDPLSGGTIVKGPWEFEAKIPRQKTYRRRQSPLASIHR